MDFQIINPSGVYPNTVRIGTLDLYYPNPKSRIDLRHEIENHLRLKYKPGIYTGPQANEISQYIFSFYSFEFKKTINLIDDSFFIYYTLFQIDLATRIQNQFRSGELIQKHANYWAKKGPLYRRTLSYLLDEMIAQFNFPKIPNQPFAKALMDFDRFFILSEKAIEYSIISNEIYYLNDSYKVKINPLGSEYFIESVDTKESKKYSRLHNYYLKQTAKDSILREKYIIGKPYEQDWIKHGNFLNNAFKKTIGLSYNEFMYLLSDICIKTKPINDEKDIPLVKKDEFIRDIAVQFQITSDEINRFFEGLILKQQHLKLNSRSFTKFKQLYRVGKRPFLEINKSDGTFLTWSNELLKERLDFLDNDFIFKNLPLEWNNKLISLAVDRISNDAGKWFENQVKINLLKMGLFGDIIKDRIVSKKTALECRKIGGFDFLGYSPNDNMLILIECKFINPGFEPRSYYDDLDSFINPKSGFIRKMGNKVAWIEKNFSVIKEELSQRLKIQIPDTCCIVGSAFFTYIKTFAYAFITRYPCVSFTEFLENYNTKQKWYFKSGLTKIKYSA